MSFARFAKFHAALIKATAPSSTEPRQQDDLASKLKIAAQKDDLETFKQLAQQASGQEVFLSYNSHHKSACAAELACRSSKSEGMVQSMMDNGLQAQRAFKMSDGSPGAESVFTLSLKLAQWETAAMIALTLRPSDSALGQIGLINAAIGAGRFPNQDENDLIAAGALISSFANNARKADPTGPLGAEHPLMALAAPHMGALGALIKLGVDVNAPDKKGRSPLHIAAAQASEDAVALLLAHGAHVKALDAQGRAPLGALCASIIASPRPGNFISTVLSMGAEERVAAALLAAGANPAEASFVRDLATRSRLGLDPASAPAEMEPAHFSRRVLARSQESGASIKPRAGSQGPR